MRAAERVARLGILASLGALAVGVALALLRAGSGQGAGPLAIFVLLGGLGVLVLGVVLLGGAAADTVQGWRDRWGDRREK
jgi:hypothetical protein